MVIEKQDSYRQSKLVGLVPMLYSKVISMLLSSDAPKYVCTGRADWGDN